MLKIFREDFIYNFVNNTVFMALMIIVSIYSCVSIHTLKQENAVQAQQLHTQTMQFKELVSNIANKQTQFQLQMTTSLFAESAILAKMADEVKAEQVSLAKAQKENATMIKQLALLKKHINKIERRQNGLN